MNARAIVVILRAGEPPEVREVEPGSANTLGEPVTDPRWRANGDRGFESGMWVESGDPT